MFTMFNRRSGSSNERYTSEEQVEAAVERQDQQQPQHDESLTATELHADVAGNDGSRIDHENGTNSREEDEEAEYEDEDEDDDHTVILNPDEEEIPPPFPADLMIHRPPFRLGRMANDRLTTHRILLMQRNTGNNEDDDPLRHVLDEATDQDFFYGTEFENETNEDRRRIIIQREIRRIQRVNFIHFAFLCLIPTSLLLVVLATVSTDDGGCDSDDYDVHGIVCEKEPRQFLNAFTSRCICDGLSLED